MEYERNHFLEYVASLMAGFVGAMIVLRGLSSESMEEMTIPQLENCLKVCVQNEDYEKAAEIRDFINSKKTQLNK
jgi:protein-arginine kinase activator protein McsA